eukprot:gene35517-7166_t
MSGLKASGDEIGALADDSQRLASALDALHAELHDKAQKLLTDEQCLGLDGATSLTAQRKLGRGLDDDELRPPKKRRDNRAVEDALATRVRQHEMVLRSLDARMASLTAQEIPSTEEQVAQLKAMRDARTNDRDIACKRIRLRNQRPASAGDKVNELLVKEYDALSAVIKDLSNRLNHLTVESARLHTTSRAVQNELECLDLPFAHREQFPTGLYNAMCDTHSTVYGIRPEKRLAADGCWYTHEQWERKLAEIPIKRLDGELEPKTKEQFFRKYGSLKEWDIAPPDDTEDAELQEWSAQAWQAAQSCWAPWIPRDDAQRDSPRKVELACYVMEVAPTGRRD